MRIAAPADLAAAGEEWQRCRDRWPISHRIHLALAVVYLLLLPVATAPQNYAFGFLVVWWIVRLRSLWRLSLIMLRDPLVWALLAWLGFSLLSMLWSETPEVAADEYGAARVLVLPILFLGVIDRVRWLIGALLAGVFLVNLEQLAQHLELFGWSPGPSMRLCGSLHAVHTASFCVAAISWHLAALFETHPESALRSRLTVAATVAGLLVATAGLLATGSRGPWIAAGVVVPLQLGVIAWRRPGQRRRVISVGAAGLVVLVAAGIVARPFLVDRLGRAVSEVRAAAHGDDVSDVGGRIRRWRAALDLFGSSPFVGVGAGDYVTAGNEAGHTGLNPHAHSIYLQTLATTGLVGAILLATVLVTALRRAAADIGNHPYAPGTLYVLVGWLVAAQFDCSQFNGNMFGLFAVCLAVTLPYRPQPL